MKQSFTILAVLVLAAPSAWGQFDEHSTISVRGEATVHVIPDRIIIRFGIQTDDKDMATAKQNNNDILQAFVAAAAELDIPEKEIQTAQLSIIPQWRDWQQKSSFVGYFVRNSITITVTDVEIIEPLVTAALEKGVNYIHGIEYETTELKRHREHARELALLAAKEKAEKMSAALGLTAGRPVSITESWSGTPYPRWSAWYGGYWGHSGGYAGGSQVQVQAAPNQPGETTDTIAFGKISVGASVSVVFQLTD